MGLLDRLGKNVVSLFSEETRVTRYVVLTASVGGVTAPGGPIEVIGSEWAAHFELPGIINAHSVLTFGARPSAGGTRFTARVSTSHEPHIVDHTFADAERQLFHVVLRPAVLKESGNEIIFSVASGPGDTAGVVTFFDAVIMYTTDKLTIKSPPVFTQ
jgi:hypothetical protein